MGHREDLLEGAKRCLYVKGYERTTARDIVAASGTNLASIGYHFGSKEALLNAALLEAIEEWGDELQRALAGDLPPRATPLERFEAIWARVIESFDTHRQLWKATYDAMTVAQHSPEVRAFLSDAMQQGRLGLAELFSGIDPAAGEKQAAVVGSFYQALLSGVWVQWVVDPERSPSGHDLAEALRVIMESMGPAGAGSDGRG
jgi:AcrR family transcriptional regulator